MKLGMTEAEALEVIADDDDIEHGKKKEFDLTPEQQKIAKQYTHTGTRKGSAIKKPRKENPDKREIMNRIYDLFRDSTIDNEPVENVNMSNPERQINFDFNGNNYSITLTQHRKPKGE